MPITPRAHRFSRPRPPRFVVTGPPCSPGPPRMPTGLPSPGTPFPSRVEKAAPRTGALTCVIEGLHNGTNYAFVVTATNAVGTSSYSNPSNQITPAGVPDQPTAPTATRSDAEATVYWPATRGNGSPVTGYTVTATPGGANTATTDATTCTVHGLTNGTAHTFTVVASNSVGASPASAPSHTVTPAGVPHPTHSATAVRGNTQATVSWAAAGGNGSPVTGYTVTAMPGGKTCTTTDATTCTVDGLTNGNAYTFIVAASNSMGTSPASAPSHAITPAGVPDQPTAPTAVRGDGRQACPGPPPAATAPPSTATPSLPPPAGTPVPPLAPAAPWTR